MRLVCMRISREDYPHNNKQILQLRQCEMVRFSSRCFVHHIQKLEGSIESKEKMLHDVNINVDRVTTNANTLMVTRLGATTNNNTTSATSATSAGCL
jgi:hypothetical protein